VTRRRVVLWFRHRGCCEGARARGSGTQTNAKSRRWSCRHCLLDLYRNMNYLSRKRNVVLLKESRGFETRFEHYIPNALLQLPGAV
jgi:hypothetical protein